MPIAPYFPKGEHKGVMNAPSKSYISVPSNHRRSWYRGNGDKSPPWEEKELVYQEPESIEVLILTHYDPDVKKSTSYFT